MTPRIPGCSYRLQLNKNFNFRDASALVDYLDALGVTDIYASPFLVARPGSAHGYDVIDHSRLNPEIGTDGDLEALSAALKQRGMGLLMDVVPNHMCIASSDNHWWNDVLENGRSSPFAAFFDIDWHPPKPELHEKVLLPVLGEQYGRVLESQELSITYDAGAFYARYWSSRYPIGPRTILPLLEPIVDDLRRSHPSDHPDVLEIESIVTATKHLPTRWDTEPEQVRERMREKEIVKRRIDALVSGSAAVRDAMERSLAAINGDKRNPRTFDRLEALLGDQAYRLSFWGVAAEEINYRRFFDINDLAAIRVELPNVLDAVHEKAFQLLRAGVVTGLRIDHVDGLLDPSRYLERLQRACGAAETTAAETAAAAPSAGDGRLQTYVVVEKILSGDETLPREWPIHGTTGYDFLNAVNGLFVDPGGARAIEKLYQRIREGRGEFDDLFYQARRLILRTAMSAELYVLARRLDRISEQHRWSRDFTQNSLHLALAEVIACFPVYRTYTQATSTEVSAGDRLHILRAIRDAKRRNRSTSESVFDFIADLLLLRDPDGLSDNERAERREFVLRLQQLTGPVMAKGLEDTAFYRYYPLASLNEVGGRPSGGGIDPAGVHAWNARRASAWPHSLSATHDTKRGEDVRARLNVLSEIPREWQRVVRHWQRLNRRLKSVVEDVRIPSDNEEYFIYQTLVGVWPMDAIEADLTNAARESLRARLHEYMTKALREAKVHTSWININQPYEQGVLRFIDLLLQPSSPDSFVSELRRFVGGILLPGICNSLAQVVLKITSPGVPDIYQGTELWDLSLVDPDNRRPVDFEARRALLADLAGRGAGELRALCADLLRHPADGRVKLLVLTRALHHRRRHRALYDRGAYVQMKIEGARARHAFAFARTLDGDAALTIVGRLFAPVVANGAPPVGEASWTDTQVSLPPGLHSGPYRDALTGSIVELERGSSVRLSRAFANLPVAILEPA